MIWLIWLFNILMNVVCWLCALPPIISLIQLPVAQAVPAAVGLVPPSFPVSMGMPPPGFGPPPPFIRAGFNASQPPPGKCQHRWLSEHQTCRNSQANVCVIVCRLYAGSTECRHGISTYM